MSLINCNECGKEISDTSKSCIHCGCPVHKMLKCSECGVESPDTEKVCPNCGNKLGGSISITVEKPDLNKINFSNSKIKLSLIALIVFVTIGVVGFIIFGDSNKISLQEVYDSIGCSSTYCSIASDESYLEIDTNPFDLDDYSSYSAAGLIEDANRELGFSESLYTRMGKTRALDGTLTDENKNVKVSWTYHPDAGLEVVYTLK